MGLINKVLRESTNFFRELDNFVVMNVVDSGEGISYEIQLLNNHDYTSPIILNNSEKSQYIILLDHIKHIYDFLERSLQEIRQMDDGSERIGYIISVLEIALDSMERYRIIYISFNNSEGALYGITNHDGDVRSVQTMSLKYALNKLYPDNSIDDKNYILEIIQDYIESTTRNDAMQLIN